MIQGASRLAEFALAQRFKRWEKAGSLRRRGRPVKDRLAMASEEPGATAGASTLLILLGNSRGAPRYWHVFGTVEEMAHRVLELSFVHG